MYLRIGSQFPILYISIYISALQIIIYLKIDCSIYNYVTLSTYQFCLTRTDLQSGVKAEWLKTIELKS